MRVTRTGMLAAAMMMAASASMTPMEPNAPEPERGSARHKPGSNTPVPGGGAKERAKRIAQMEKAAAKAAKV